MLATTLARETIIIMQRLTRRVSVIRMTNRAARQSHRRQHVIGSDSSVALE